MDPDGGASEAQERMEAQVEKKIQVVQGSPVQ
jgi:hypothetical protein